MRQAHIVEEQTIKRWIIKAGLLNYIIEETNGSGIFFLWWRSNHALIAFDTPKDERIGTYYFSLEDAMQAALNHEWYQFPRTREKP